MTAPALMLLSRMAPKGALPGCPGQIEVDVDHRPGGWSSDCDVDITIRCEARLCWWSRDHWDGAITPDLLREAERQHAEDATGGAA